MSHEHRQAPSAVVVGAGLAGLACAQDLCRAGWRVTLLEASDGVGGRMRTDRKDGFLLDRGFQVFNTSYPQVKRRLDLKSLRLRPFTAGFIVHTPNGPVRVADPTREPGAVGALLPGLTVPDTRTVTTYDHATDGTPTADPTLMVDSAGALLNTCALSEVAPGYAPRGTGLVSTSVLGTDFPGRAQAVLRRLAELYGVDTSDWQQIAAYTVEGALPAMLPPWPLGRTTRLGPGRHVCGDYRATGSVQGALASGARAAREVSADSGRRR
ncbi:FAD-dependent oxidoreductase [Streptomyces sp. NPDC020412]|uniref:FAD-dependent oxidoreductase n=1 Tax=Streptomyces sp. NPDC020412 TaxID=3365073 RepID=UPI00378BD2DE